MVPGLAHEARAQADEMTPQALCTCLWASAHFKELPEMQIWPALLSRILGESMAIPLIIEKGRVKTACFGLNVPLP